MTVTTVQQPLLLRAGKLEVSLAASLPELDAAYRLRFEVFNLELQEGLRASFDRGYDTDAYDAYCDHLIVRDLESQTVVGTYRLLRRSRAQRNIGFYSENEFDLGNLKKLPGELLELGRSCIASTHRSFATINLLWQAITQYARQTGVSYLFGCASLHVTARADVQRLYAYLRARHYAPAAWQVAPLASCRMFGLDDELARDLDERQVARELPPLLRGYLRAGAVICGPPALDADFGTADVLVLLPMEQMARRYRQHYTTGAWQ